MRGKAMSGAPIISGTNQLPKPPIIAGMTMKKIIKQAVGGDEHVEHVLAGIEGGIALGAIDHGGETVENLDARLLQLDAHDDRQDAADQAGEDREPQIHRADVLVVGRIDISPPSGRMAVIVMSGGCVCHCSSLLRSQFCASWPLALSVATMNLWASSTPARLGLLGPGIEIGFGNDMHLDRHVGVVLAAELRALAVVDAFPGRP